MSGAIDTLEVQVPGEEVWSTELRRLSRGGVSGGGPFLQWQGWRYRRFVDLRQHGFSAMLYLDSRRCGSNKLVMNRVGGMPYKNVLAEIGALFDSDVLDFTVMRVDMAVDVVDYPVQWFKDHVAVRRRQCRGEIGTISYQTNVRRGVETLYFGKRPNLFRIYDKIAQLRTEGHRRNRLGALSHPVEEPWTEMTTVTRIERQYGGSRIPEQLATLGKIQADALKINPFEPLEFLFRAFASIPADLSGSAFLKALGLRTLVEDQGMQGAIAELNRRTGGKGIRLIGNVQNHMSRDEPVVPPNLVEMYRQSLASQLGAAA